MERTHAPRTHRLGEIGPWLQGARAHESQADAVGGGGRITSVPCTADGLLLLRRNPLHDHGATREGECSDDTPRVHAIRGASTGGAPAAE